MTTPAGEEFVKKTEEARRSLRTLLDEMRVQLQLASMDAKDAWQDLEPQLGRVESRLEEVSQRLKQASEEAELQAHLGMKEAESRWEELRETVSDVVENVLETITDRSQAPKRAIDRSKVQAHLARLEAEDRFVERADELKARLAQSRSEVMQEASRFVDGLTTSLLGWSERLARRDGKDGK